MESSYISVHTIVPCFHPSVYHFVKIGLACFDSPSQFFLSAGVIILLLEDLLNKHIRRFTSLIDHGTIIGTKITCNKIPL